MWQLSGNINIASAHVVMHQKDSFYEVSFKLRKIFHELGVHSLTLQPEIYDCFEGESKCGSAKCCFLSDFKKEEISGFVNSICCCIPRFFDYVLAPLFVPQIFAFTRFKVGYCTFRNVY